MNVTIIYPILDVAQNCLPCYTNLSQAANREETTAELVSGFYMVKDHAKVDTLSDQPKKNHLAATPPFCSHQGWLVRK